MQGRKRLSGVAFGLGLAIALSVAGPGGASAQTESGSDALVRQLECKGNQECTAGSPLQRSRGVTDGRAVDRARSFQFWREEDRKAVEESADDGTLPSVDVEIYFDFNSSKITRPARSRLTEIGEALTNPKLAKGRFILIGHTDARGSDAYNRALSERRAASARDYLLKNFPIDPERLDAYGRGKGRLKAPNEPGAAINRRVQIINVGSTAEIQR